METNKVELTGTIGKINPNSFSLCVQEIYSDDFGINLIQTLWLQVYYPEINKNFTKGDKVNIVGKLFTEQYADQNGITHFITSIKAKNIVKV